MSKLLDQAELEVRNLNVGEEFIVKDLFKGYLWNRLSHSERLRLGRAFLYNVEEEKIKDVQKLQKNSANQQKYKKIK